MEKEQYTKSVLDLEDVQEALECVREIALSEGLAQGIEQGIVQGIVQGIEQGRAEKEKQIVLNLMANGFDAPTIIRITGLTEEEVLTAQG